MQWHDYTPAYKGLAAARRFKGTPKECAEYLAAVLFKNTRGTDRDRTQNTRVQLRQEAAWTADDRPYYDLYPSVAGAFTKLDLEKVKCEQLRLPLPVLMIRMPVGKELQLTDRTVLHSALIAESHSDNPNERAWLLSIETAATMEINGVTMPMHTVVGCRMPDGDAMTKHLAQGQYRWGEIKEIDFEAATKVFKIIATLCMLGGDPDLIQPEPLAADLEKYEASHNPALIEKAARRGKRAWSVGKHIEVAPGYRNPHFAIRWMEKGRTVPRVRPIKGCLVRRKEIQEVPTDWLGPEVPAGA